MAVVVEEKDPELNTKIKNSLPIDKAHIEQIPLKEIYSSTLFISLITEGFSIKKNKFLKETLGIKPMKLYRYNLLHLNKSEKTQFGRALNQTLKKIKGEKVSIGSVLIPVNKTGYFEDFLDVWNLKYKTKEWTVF